MILSRLIRTYSIKTMIRSKKPEVLLFLWVVLFSFPSLAHDHAPSAKTFTFKELELRYLKKQEDIRWLVEWKAAETFDEEIANHLRLGAYYRLRSWLKLGFFHRLQQNVRNEDDWINTPDHDWKWDKQRDNYENVLAPNLLARYMVFENLRFEFRLQYEYNFWNDFQQVLIRPGLNYFWLRGAKPFLNLYFHYEHHKPLNFGNYDVSEAWTYLGALYHLTRANKIGLYAAFGSWTWTTSEEALRARDEEPYEISDKATRVGLTYIFSH